MGKIFYEDAYCLGLLYAYIYSGKKMMLLDDLKKFHNTIEQNLTETDTFYSAVWYDNDPSIYYSSEGKNGEIYCVLYPDFDLEKAKSKYIGCISIKTLIASQKENALKCLDLQKIDGNITKKEKNIHVGITESNIFMKKFMEKLKSGELKIEICSQIKNDSELTEEFIVHQLEEYHKLLNTSIIDKIKKEEQGPVKKLIKNKELK